MAKKLVQTRNSSSAAIFGTEKDLEPDNAVLPTYEDVIRCFQSVRLQQKRSGVKQPSKFSIAAVVAQKVELIWKRASLPILSRKRVVDMITTYHQKYRSLIKPLKSRDSEQFKTKLNKFKTDAGKLFDICACKCKDIPSCKCEKSRKVPEIEFPFLVDQRNGRKMIIGGIDRNVTRKLNEKLNRKEKQAHQIGTAKDTAVASTSGLQQTTSSISQEESSSTESSSSENAEEEEEFKWSYDLTKKSKDEKIETQMRVSMVHAAKAADLTGISNRSAAKIATAVLQDMQIVSQKNTSKVVDKNKIRRALLRNRKEMVNKLHNEKEFIEGLYFDGRKDQTTLQLDGRRVKKFEEHISLVEEPGSLYFGHISLTTSTKAVDQANGILFYLHERGIDLSRLTVIGCDGTNLNTGWKGGVIRLLEIHLGKPLQWSICYLHANELPLRHLLQKLDGHTTGPYQYSGPIGCLLNDCHTLAVVPFRRIETALPEIDHQELSTDQQYLYRICEAIASGNCSRNLAQMNPGKLSHSRWLTTANRVLRLYVSTSEPSANLPQLSEFIVKVYATVWFATKTKPLLQFGARHLWQTIYLSRYFPDNIREVVDKVISTNAYYAHPENILVSMLTDSRKHIRELGFRRILKARNRKSKSIRIFKVPTLNFNAQDYVDLINWNECVVTEPPLTMTISDEELRNFIENEEALPLIFKKFPCHTQAVERCVKIVTEAASEVCSKEARDGYIAAKLDARRALPTFENKAQYFSNISG